MKMLYRYWFLIGVLICLPGMAGAQPNIGVFIDQNVYVLGSEASFPVYVTGQGAEEPVTVDVHLGLISPDGKIYEYKDWNTELNPWVPAFTVPAGLKYGPHVIFDLKQFPHWTPGLWRVAAALTEPGTTNFLSVSVQWINVLASTATDDVTRIGVLSMVDSSTGSERSQAAWGSFIELNVGTAPTEEQIKQIMDSLAGEMTALDQCEFNETSGTTPTDGSIGNLPSGALPVFLDAGEQLTLMREDGMEVFVPLDDSLRQEGIFMYQADLPGGFYDTQRVYSFSGPGGTQVGPFQVSAHAPAPLTLTSPNLASGAASHSVSSDLELKWNGQSGQGTVNVAISNSSFDFGSGESVSKAVYCRFVDDGEGVVPADMLGRLGASALVPASISVTRSAYTAFNTSDNSLDIGIFLIATGVNGSLTLQ